MKAVEIVGVEKCDFDFRIVSIDVIADLLDADDDEEAVFAEVAPHELLARVAKVRLHRPQDLLRLQVVDAQAIVQIVVVVLENGRMN